MKPPCRDEFRRAVLARDHGRCVLCGEPAAEAHHVLEARLFADGGDHLANGVSLCAAHAQAATCTNVSVEELRRRAGITEPSLPPQFTPGEVIDRWGNPILPHGTRMRGELFGDEAVRKILADRMHLFTELVKFPRTMHLPWSPGLQNDDRMIASLDGLRAREVVVTEKMDGENASLYRDHCHARSLDGRDHPSRNWLKGRWAALRHEIPEGWRVCGENLFAVHSISYAALPSYFLGFSIWNERNVALPWDETLEWLALLGLEPVPELYRGPFDEGRLRVLGREIEAAGGEGFVVRRAEAIPYAAYGRLVAKWVRPAHVQTDQHWMNAPVVRNGLRAEEATTS